MEGHILKDGLVLKDAHSESFMEALINRNLAAIRRTPKADLHNGTLYPQCNIQWMAYASGWYRSIGRNS